MNSVRPGTFNSQPLIPQSFIQDLLARLDIVDVIERHVPLKRAGANLVACCPFHNEKTPSFSVSPTKQFYHCFGCGAHGSAIGFVMQFSGLGFVDAVRELAGSVGMSLPQQSGPVHLEASDNEALWRVMSRAARFYREQLKRSPRAIDYLKGRGLTGEIAARFGIGYAPDGWHSLGELFEESEAELIHRAGLTIRNEQGRVYDRFRDRVMFPIQDVRGNVIAFGGRVIGDGEPKYLNSPETPIFEKGHELYGMLQARNAIRAEGTVIVVEGYMDVVALAQSGIGNAVATLGTATTPVHVRKLLRLARRVVFCFDGDTAGLKAAWRAFEASLEHLADDRLVAFLLLPEQHDPDSYVRELGADRFRQAAKSAMPLTEFLLRELKSRGDLSSAEGRARLVADAKPLLTRIAAPILRAQLVRALAELSRLTPGELEALCGLQPLRAISGRPPPNRAPRPSLARRVLRIVLQRPEWAASLPVEHLPEGEPESATLRAIAQAFNAGLLPAGRLDTVAELFRGTEHEALLEQAYGELDAELLDEGTMEAVFSDAIEQLRRRSITREIADLNARGRSGQLTTEERQRLGKLLIVKNDIGAGAGSGEID